MRAAAILFLTLLCGAPSAFGCSPIAPVAVEFDAALARPGDTPPGAPPVRVDGIGRGYAKDTLDTSCAGTGMIFLSMPDTAEVRSLAYRFEVLSGGANRLLFPTVPVSSATASEGRRLYVLPFADAAKSPLRWRVRVTPYRKSGLAGAPVELDVIDPGN